MTTNTTTHRRRQTANTNHNSNPTFLQVALRPYRRDDPERYIVISTRNPTITVLKRLADALGVPPAALLE